MRLLINTTDIGCQIVHNTPYNTKRVENTIRSALEDYAKDELKISFRITTFGSENPDEILSIAKSWNDTIRLELYSKMNRIKSLQLDSDFTHELYLAARAADNKFSVYGNYGVLSDNYTGWYTFTVILSNDKLTEITNHPEEWIVADMFAY